LGLNTLPPELLKTFDAAVVVADELVEMLRVRSSAPCEIVRARGTNTDDFPNTDVPSDDVEFRETERNVPEYSPVELDGVIVGRSSGRFSSSSESISTGGAVGMIGSSSSSSGDIAV
jgi:hypothetical protein